MKKIVLALAAVTAVAAPAALVAAPANAAPARGCVTKAEWSHVHRGLTRSDVLARTGTYGQTTKVGPGYSIAVYTRCDWTTGPKPVVLFSTAHRHRANHVPYWTRVQTIESLTNWAGHPVYGG